MSAHHPSFDLNYYEERSKRLKKSDYAVEILNIDTSSPEYNMIRWHWHEELEFIYIQRGYVYITCEDKGITAKEGDIIFINQQKKHFISPANEDGFAFTSIIFHPLFLLGLGHLELEQKYIAPLLDDASIKAIWFQPSNDIYSELQPLIHHIIEINEKQDLGYEILTKAWLLQIWYFMYNNNLHPEEPKISKLNTQDEHRVKQAILFIQDHFMESITLDDISSSIMVSKSECCRCFKRALNITPFEYLMKYRIMESTKRMHKRSTESISEIAGSVGFNNTSYFNKIFKKYMNCTPSEYKATIKKDFSSLL